VVTRTEYAVATRTYIDEPHDVFDDGSGWSTRYGRKYTLQEALEQAARRKRQDAKVVVRVVTETDWEDI
jgi:hypothetical protein